MLKLGREVEGKEDCTYVAYLVFNIHIHFFFYNENHMWDLALFNSHPSITNIHLYTNIYQRLISMSDTGHLKSTSGKCLVYILCYRTTSCTIANQIDWIDYAFPCFYVNFAFGQNDFWTKWIKKSLPFTVFQCFWDCKRTKFLIHSLWLSRPNNTHKYFINVMRSEIEFRCIQEH